ncbi:MAG: NUDIX hydrolase [Bacteroidaceae bacterium]|nr:NUDIX hydrolase [Bacteroidaceae bacterium]
MGYTYDYPRPAVTAACLVITEETIPKVLLVQRREEPCKGSWTIPGGLVKENESLEQCACRCVYEETGYNPLFIEQLHTYSEVDRDPYDRTITTVYICILKRPSLVMGQGDAAQAEWFTFQTIPTLAFDHKEILDDALSFFRFHLEADLEKRKMLDPASIPGWGASLHPNGENDEGYSFDLEGDEDEFEGDEEDGTEMHEEDEMYDDELGDIKDVLNSGVDGNRDKGEKGFFASLKRFFKK